MISHHNHIKNPLHSVIINLHRINTNRAYYNLPSIIPSIIIVVTLLNHHLYLSSSTLYPQFKGVALEGSLPPVRTPQQLHLCQFRSPLACVGFSFRLAEALGGSDVCTVDGWMDGWMDGWIPNGWMDGWIDRQV